MSAMMALIVGVLYGAGLYLMMRRTIVKLILGLALLSHGSNLLIFLVSGVTRGRPPIIPAGETRLATPFADPVPQALVLTAIVIGFGVIAFAVVLIKRVHEALETDDLALVWLSLLLNHPLQEKSHFERDPSLGSLPICRGAMWTPEHLCVVPVPLPFGPPP